MNKTLLSGILLLAFSSLSFADVIEHKINITSQRGMSVGLKSLNLIFDISPIKHVRLIHFPSQWLNPWCFSNACPAYEQNGYIIKNIKFSGEKVDGTLFEQLGIYTLNGFDSNNNGKAYLDVMMETIGGQICEVAAAKFSLDLNYQYETQIIYRENNSEELQHREVHQLMVPKWNDGDTIVTNLQTKNADTTTASLEMASNRSYKSGAFGQTEVFCYDSDASLKQVQIAPEKAKALYESIIKERN